MHVLCDIPKIYIFGHYTYDLKKTYRQKLFESRTFWDFDFDHLEA